MGRAERRVGARVGTWVELADALVTRPTTAFPHQLLSARMHETFGCRVAWNWLDDGGTPGFVVHPPVPGWPTPEMFHAMTAVIHHHPLLRWFAATGDMTAMSIGRVPRGLVTPTGHAAVRDFLEPVGLQEQLAIPYRLGLTHHRAFVLARGDDDFSAEDLWVARQIQPLLRLLDRHYAAVAPEHGGEVGAAVDAGLTVRELAVLTLLADGYTASTIGDRLVISPRTVHRHLQGIYRKLGVADRVRAVLVAREAGLMVEQTASGAATRLSP